MLYYLDTAHLDSIQQAMECFPLSGVTTNPSIISKECQPLGTLLRDIRSCIGPSRMLFAQVIAREAEQMVREADALRQWCGPSFSVKIPATVQGLKAIASIKRQDPSFHVTATAIFTPQQALLCARAGADYVAPYINRLDNFGADGIQVIAEISRLFSTYKLPCQTVGASFRNVQQIHSCALAGAGAVTVSPDLLPLLLQHPLTDAAVEEFKRHWANMYGAKADLIEQLK